MGSWWTCVSGCRVRIAALGAAVAIVASAIAADRARAASSVPDDYFGVSAPNFFVMGQRGQDGALDSYLTNIRGAGIDWVRDAVPWPDAEPAPPTGGAHTYRWRAFDGQITRYAEHGLTLQPVIRQTPWWATEPTTFEGCRRESGPSATGAAEYGSFVGAYLARYGRRGSFWAEHPELPYRPVTRVELWNEPNWSPFYCPDPDPERYAAMVSAAADAAHAVDPAAVVSTGGLVALRETMNSQRVTGMEVGEFLRRMTAAQPRLVDEVDAVAIHLYDLDPDVDISLIGWLRAKMRAAGLGSASVLVTEYGWRTNGGPGSVSEGLRARLARHFASQAPRLNCGVIGIAPHAWITAEQDQDNPENWWGIADPTTGEPYATGRMYANQIARYEGRLSEPPPASTIPVCKAPSPYPRPFPPPNHPSRVGSRFFGAMSTGWFDDVARRRAQADSMAGRITQSREVVSWRQIEPNGAADLASDASWADLDARVLRLGLRNVRMLPTFTHAPRWADPASPASAQHAFAEFLAAFAERYGRGGSFWQRNRHLNPFQLAVRDYEIWDRGNLSDGWWDRSASPAEYASAYAAAQAALRRVDPKARALVSLDQSGVRYKTFIRWMVAAKPGLRGNVDGAFVLASTSRRAAAIDQVVVSARSQLDDTGNPKAPLEVGFGWYTSGPGAMSEAERASLYYQVASRLARSDCRLSAVLARAWVTPQQDRSKPWEWYGMVDPQSFKRDRAGRAYGAVARTYLGYGRAPPPSSVLHTCHPRR
jgi:hypothetical protein